MTMEKVPTVKRKTRPGARDVTVCVKGGGHGNPLSPAYHTKMREREREEENEHENGKKTLI